jgi:SAM-dependent methyltransferase
MNSEVLESVKDYFAGKIAEYGPTPRGVDWNTREVQELRFQNLLRLLPEGESCSLIDFGCGYGALLELLNKRQEEVMYQGYDLVPSMLDQARRRFPENSMRFWRTDFGELEPADFLVASGVFNMRLTCSQEEWLAYLQETLDKFHRLTSRGFAFNVLTSWSEPEKMRPDLFYADPGELFAFCKSRFSRSVALLHDYPLWEFTILVRKDTGMPSPRET